VAAVVEDRDHQRVAGQCLDRLTVDDETHARAVDFRQSDETHGSCDLSFHQVQRRLDVTQLRLRAMAEDATAVGEQ